jgi:glycosyltransferase involved in cell wall biosynthesis
MPEYRPERVGGWDPALLVDVVIPVLNEAHVLARSVATARQFLAESLPCRWRVVVVDNGSPTDRRVAKELVAAHDDVRFLQLPQRGRGRALRHAWSQSDADVMCYTDVDLSTELAALPKMVHGIVVDGFDVATGSRLLPDSRTTRSAKREFISRCYNAFVKVVLWTSFSDAQCGFKAISRGAMADLVPQVQDQSWFFDTDCSYCREAWLPRGRHSTRDRGTTVKTVKTAGRHQGRTVIAVARGVAVRHRAR